MILVIGATGLLGMEICRTLKLQSLRVRALVRNAGSEKALRLASDGVELAVADLKDAVSLAAACRGASAVISTASSTFSRLEGDSIETVDRLGQIHAIDAAREAGVGRFVFVSIARDIKFPTPLSRAKREVEQHLAQSSIPYTILLANWFQEVWLGPALGFDYANRRARIYGTGENPVSFVSFKNVAQFAVRSLETSAAANRSFEICGPTPVSQLDAVSYFERALGQEFAKEFVPEAALRQQYDQAADALSQTFAGLTLDYSAGNAADPAESLKVVPLHLTSVEEYAKSVA
jgi:NADH dehydrogenase